jgi:hypothetical protein
VNYGDPQAGDIEDKGVSPNFLVRNWLPAFKEWNTRLVRDHRPAVDQRISHRDVEREFVIHLPDGASQGRKCLRLVDDAIRVDFKDWSDLPFVWSLDDGDIYVTCLMLFVTRCHAPHLISVHFGFGVCLSAIQVPLWAIE